MKQNAILYWLKFKIILGEHVLYSLSLANIGFLSFVTPHRISSAPSTECLQTPLAYVAHVHEAYLMAIIICHSDINATSQLHLQIEVFNERLSTYSSSCYIAIDRFWGEARVAIASCFHETSWNTRDRVHCCETN